jgi:hypothetical protein
VTTFEQFLTRLLIDRIGVLEHELGTVKARVASLESRPAIQYAGVWQSGRQYQRGHACTDRGSLWIAEFETTARPGDGAESGWKLAVKKGEADGSVPPARFPTQPRRNGFGR